MNEIEELIEEKLDRLKQLKAIVENDRNPKHWSFREHYACGHNNGYYHAINEGIEAIQQIKQSLAKDAEDQRDVLDKVIAYDQLDYRFKLVCDKGVEQTLQHLCMVGFGDGSKVNHEPVEVPEFIKNTMQQYSSLQEMLTEEYYSNDTSEMDSDAIFCWIDTNFDLLCRAWLYGCTVVKEPLYIMPVPCTHNGTLHYCLKDDGEISFRQGNAYKFNKDQIEKHFAEIKELAVPVEEEAE